jgi:hypothetical protein
MDCSVTFSTKCNQISLGIVTECAAPSQVVNIENLEAATFLTTPTISLQDISPQSRTCVGRMSDSRSFLRKRIVHFACSATVGCLEAGVE